jgi:hypothetical protein
MKAVDFIFSPRILNVTLLHTATDVETVVVLSRANNTVDERDISSESKYDRFIAAKNGAVLIVGEAPRISSAGCSRCIQR